MEQFPLTNADAGMAALVRLVTVMATKVLHGAIIGNSDFIDGKEAKAFATKTFVLLLVCISTCFSEAVLAQLFLFLLLFLGQRINLVGGLHAQEYSFVSLYMKNLCSRMALFSASSTSQR